MKSPIEHYFDRCRHLNDGYSICFCHTNDCNDISRFPSDEMLSISQEVNTGEVSELIDLSEVNATQLGQLAINDITAVKDIFLLDSSCKYG